MAKTEQQQHQKSLLHKTPRCYRNGLKILTQPHNAVVRSIGYLFIIFSLGLCLRSCCSCCCCCVAFLRRNGDFVSLLVLIGAFDDTTTLAVENEAKDWTNGQILKIIKMRQIFTAVTAMTAFTKQSRQTEKKIEWTHTTEKKCQNKKQTEKKNKFHAKIKNTKKPNTTTTWDER